MKYAHVVNGGKKSVSNVMISINNMFIVCLSLFCQLSTQSKMKIIKLYSRCVNASSSIHNYNSSFMWDVGTY